MVEYLKAAVLFVFWIIMVPAVAWGHQDVWLRNEQGDRITSMQNSADPYSPRKTCGGCHNYTAVTSGYHFQQGFDEMKDRYDEGRPWYLSPGMFGKWLPTAAAARLAPKVNSEEREIDLSTYDWIGSGSKYHPKHKVKSTSCGGCHPGGGPLEYGRDALGRADRSKTLVQAEAWNKNRLDGDYSSLATPDKKSHFRESGVVEADCLICHMPGYDMQARNEQLGRRNYRWGATTGAGLGTVTGSVFSYSHPAAGPGDPRFASGTWNFSRRPVTSYAWSDNRLFTNENRMRGQLIKKAVASKNCLQCHGEADTKNTGALHRAENDAHIKVGFTCVDCHGLVGKTPADRLRHQIAKGRSLQATVRDDLDGREMKTCIGCHTQGHYRPTRQGMPHVAKNPLETHAKRLSKATFHTYLLACNSCHMPVRPARAMIILDMSAGQESMYTADRLEGVRWAPDYDKPVPTPWNPWMMRQETQYVPVVPKWKQWFGEMMANGEVRPIPLRHIQKAALTVTGLTIIDAHLPDGAKEKRLSAVADQDITKMINRLTKMGFRNIVFVADQIYALDKGRIYARPLTSNTSYYPVEHGVVPLAGKLTYGSKGRPGGCMDCHRDNAAFFSKMEIRSIRNLLKNDYPSLKEPNAMPQYRAWKLRGIPSAE